MAIWNQTAGWSSGSLYFEGSTSGRELFRFDKDNITIPPLIGRVNLDLVSMTSQITVTTIANPTTEEIWVDKVIINVDTASSSSMCLSLGIATAAASSASNIANQTIGCSTAGMLLMNSSGTFPVAWNTTSYFAVTAVTSSGTMSAQVGDISVFYCVAVTT